MNDHCFWNITFINMSFKTTIDSKLVSIYIKRIKNLLPFFWNEINMNRKNIWIIVLFLFFRDNVLLFVENVRKTFLSTKMEYKFIFQFILFSSFLNVFCVVSYLRVYLLTLFIFTSNLCQAWMIALVLK